MADPVSRRRDSEECTDDGEGKCGVCGRTIDYTTHPVQLPDGGTDLVRYKQFHPVGSDKGGGS